MSEVSIDIVGKFHVIPEMTSHRRSVVKFQITVKSAVISKIKHYRKS